MGVKHSEQDMALSSIRELSALLDDYSQTLKTVVEKMEARNVASFPVKHITKARTSVKRLGEFTMLVNQTLNEHLFQQAFPTSTPVGRSTKMEALKK